MFYKVHGTFADVSKQRLYFNKAIDLHVLIAGRLNRSGNGNADTVKVTLSFHEKTTDLIRAAVTSELEQFICSVMTLGEIKE